ncbi:NUDIX hydrolase [Mycobacteroides chelonae]|uniref:NUDIX hydrolase n=1 Tax=Mycobacteroides chelonae TaxID=1774 RepID=A0A1S1MCC1_MYCCH|nr:NUDIX hydrolase [Mycobacteroides chelonae]OHU26070.1 NUDIX hydrolase [Mycobacteroides chelonae]OHU61920.1 NUDIX hydrolase [Mycobacteroides chelonae]OHU80213.1 NUDIX hydrolase [Mycobacteroides chelonae]QQG88725.1 NUDIX hydrolase [Mycobacteroides chelonae]QQG93541.1 NUDIX hydrolase [Mycobacteroides chelonae]
MTSTPNDPAPPKPAATVVLIRDGAVGVEAFLMRRDNAMAFAGGMTVFPGGGVDSRDLRADVPWVGPDVAWWAEQFGVTPELASALVCAAARETFEECGVLFAGTSDTSIVEDAAVYHQARKDLSDKSLSFAEFLQREGLLLRADLLRPWANWITPEAEPRRYDTFFFVAALPSGQDADGDNTEAVASGWQTPGAAISAFTERRSFLLPPTWSQLDAVSSSGATVADVLASVREIAPIMPILTEQDGRWLVQFADVDRYEAARQGAVEIPEVTGTELT